MRNLTTRARRLLMGTVTSLIATGAIAVAATPAHAVPVGTCRNLHSFTVEFGTGGDDLRSNSELAISLTTTIGSIRLESVWGTFSNNSFNTRDITFQNHSITVDSCAVTGVQIRLIQHYSWPEGADNWDMTSFELWGYAATGSVAQHMGEVDGSPLKRFTESSPTWTRGL
jgi:hypothetical protein